MIGYRRLAVDDKKNGPGPTAPPMANSSSPTFPSTKNGRFNLPVVPVSDRKGKNLEASGVQVNEASSEARARQNSDEQQFEDAPEDNSVVDQAQKENKSDKNPAHQVNDGVMKSATKNNSNSSFFNRESFVRAATPSQISPNESLSSLDALASACAAEKNVKDTPAVLSSSSVTPSSTAPPASSVPVPCQPQKNKKKSVVVESNDNGAEPSTQSSLQISNNDVLCGRGGLTNHHPGNVNFRTLVRQCQEEYLRASKRAKAGVARKVVDTIRNMNPPGRFLKKDQSNPGVWVEIGNRKAREKTSQALREGAPELREELIQALQARQVRNLQQGIQQQNLQQQPNQQTHDPKHQNQDQMNEKNKEALTLPMVPPTIGSSHRGRIVSSDSVAPDVGEMRSANLSSFPSASVSPHHPPLPFSKPPRVVSEASMPVPQTTATSSAVRDTHQAKTAASSMTSRPSCPSSPNKSGDAKVEVTTTTCDNNVSSPGSKKRKLDSSSSAVTRLPTDEKGEEQQQQSKRVCVSSSSSSSSELDDDDTDEKSSRKGKKRRKSKVNTDNTSGPPRRRFKERMLEHAF